MLIHYFHIRTLKSDGCWCSLCFSLMPGVYGFMIEPECVTARGKHLIISPRSPCINPQLSVILCAVISATPTYSHWEKKKNYYWWVRKEVLVQSYLYLLWWKHLFIHGFNKVSCPNQLSSANQSDIYVAKTAGWMNSILKWLSQWHFWSLRSIQYH